MSNIKLSAAAVEALHRVKSGDDFGETFTQSGEVFSEKTGDIVSISSINIDPCQLTVDFVEGWFSKYCGISGVVFGLFRVTDGTISVDVNAHVPREHRESTLAFAKWNKQDSIWSIDNEDIVHVGAGVGGNEINKDDLVAIVGLLVAGKWTGENGIYEPEWMEQPRLKLPRVIIPLEDNGLKPPLAGLTATAFGEVFGNLSANGFSGASGSRGY